MVCHLHHVHLFASDVDRSIRFYTEIFGGRVVLDAELAGARNVFIAVGKGRLHLYDQPPKDDGRGGIHHIGVQTDDIESMVARLEDKQVSLRTGLRDFGFWRYIMVPGPDDVLIELFQISSDAMPAELADYFC